MKSFMTKNEDPSDVIAAAKLAVNMQPIARALIEVLREQSGGYEDIAFTLVVSVGKCREYVANVTREDGRKMLQELLEEWSELNDPKNDLRNKVAH